MLVMVLTNVICTTVVPITNIISTTVMQIAAVIRTTKKNYNLVQHIDCRYQFEFYHIYHYYSNLIRSTR